MADVLRGLGYRVHPPTDETGPLHAFSVKPRFVREREEQRERQRLQERERRDQRRRERPERPNERQFFADAPRRDGPPRRSPGAMALAGPDRKERPPTAAGRPRTVPRKDGPPRDDRRGRARRAATPADRRCDSTPRRRRRARRFQFTLRQAARAQARRKEIACRADAARQMALACALLQDPFARRALCREGALPASTAGSPTSRTPLSRRAWC